MTTLIFDRVSISINYCLIVSGQAFNKKCPVLVFLRIFFLENYNFLLQLRILFSLFVIVIHFLCVSKPLKFQSICPPELNMELKFGAIIKIGSSFFFLSFSSILYICKSVQIRNYSNFSYF